MTEFHVPHLTHSHRNKPVARTIAGVACLALAMIGCEAKHPDAGSIATKYLTHIAARDGSAEAMEWTEAPAALRAACGTSVNVPPASDIDRYDVVRISGRGAGTNEELKAFEFTYDEPGWRFDRAVCVVALVDIVKNDGTTAPCEVRLHQRQGRLWVIPAPTNVPVEPR